MTRPCLHVGFGPRHSAGSSRIIPNADGHGGALVEDFDAGHGQLPFNPQEWRNFTRPHRR